jgi:hypothetical protein
VLGVSDRMLLVPIACCKQPAITRSTGGTQGVAGGYVRSSGPLVDRGCRDAVMEMWSLHLGGGRGCDGAGGTTGTI